MMKNKSYRAQSLILSILFSFQAIVSPALAAESKNQGTSLYALPPDKKDGRGGSVYFTSNKEDEVLMKTNVWGAVQFPGVHYLPLGTRLLDALSIAGGPLDFADKESITLSTNTEKGLVVQTFSINKALSDPASNPYIQANDLILVKEDNFYKNWSLGLGIGTFVISAIVLGFVSQDRNK